MSASTEESEEAPITLLTVSYCFNLTSNTSPILNVGTIRLRGDEYLGFTWDVDPEPLLARTDPMSAMMIRFIPETMSATSENWLPYKNRARRRVDDPDTMAGYYCKSFRHSSIYISAVVPEVVVP